jgi:hypothetical protein
VLLRRDTKLARRQSLIFFLGLAGHTAGARTPSSRAMIASNRDGSTNESILESLDPGVGDLEDYENENYNSSEYDAAMKEFEAELA